MVKVTIDRTKWARGSESCLLTSDATYCCLGFICKQDGFTDKQILGISDPVELTVTERISSLFELKHQYPLLAKLVAETNDCFYNTTITNNLIETNDDDSYISDAPREQKIKMLGQAIGIDFEFVN